MVDRNEVNNSQDIIDSRDVIEAIEEIEGEIADLEEEIEELETERLEVIDENEDTASDLLSQIEDKRDMVEGLQDELKPLKDLAEQCEGYGDWDYGEALIRDTHFRDYAMELAEDIGAMPKDAQWPCTCIDWDHAAKELQMDYTCVEFEGVDYWLRS